MIIDKDGNLLQLWERKNGKPIFDCENKYGVEFHIVVPYTAEQTEMYTSLKMLKKMLEQTDYKALKYADGAYTEEEYAPIRQQRAEWRALINEIEAVFIEPTLTREEIDRAEALAMEKLKEAKNADSKLADSADSG